MSPRGSFFNAPVSFAGIEPIASRDVIPFYFFLFDNAPFLQLHCARISVSLTKKTAAFDGGGLMLALNHLATMPDFCGNNGSFSVRYNRRQAEPIG